MELLVNAPCLPPRGQACDLLGPGQDLTKHFLCLLDVGSSGLPNLPGPVLLPPGSTYKLGCSPLPLSVLAPQPSFLITIRPSQSSLQGEEQVSEGQGLQPKQSGQHLSEPEDPLGQQGPGSSAGRLRLPPEQCTDQLVPPSNSTEFMGQESKRHVGANLRGGEVKEVLQRVGRREGNRTRHLSFLSSFQPHNSMIALRDGDCHSHVTDNETEAQQARLRCQDFIRVSLSPEPKLNVEQWGRGEG